MAGGFDLKKTTSGSTYRTPPSAVTAQTAVPFFDVHGDEDGRVYPFLAAFTSRYLGHLGVAPAKNRLASASRTPFLVACAISLRDARCTGSRPGRRPRAMGRQQQGQAAPGDPGFPVGDDA